MNWYGNGKENVIVAIWVIIIQAFQRRDVHRVLVNQPEPNGLDIQMVGDQVVQHLDPVLDKVWLHRKVAAIKDLHGIRYRLCDKIAASMIPDIKVLVPIHLNRGDALWKLFHNSIKKKKQPI